MDLLNDFLSNLFLTIESWILVFVVLVVFWLWVASWNGERPKTVAWAAILIITIIFVSGIFFAEVRRFFYLLFR
jgi:hypothetical protein